MNDKTDKLEIFILVVGFVFVFAGFVIGALNGLDKREFLFHKESGIPILIGVIILVILRIKMYFSNKNR